MSRFTKGLTACLAIAAATVALALASIGVAAAAPDAAQPTPEEIAAMMEKWAKVAAPGEHHKHLEGFVGNWNTVTRMWMGGPGSDATESKGTSEVKLVLGGRFAMEEHAGEMHGQPYNGIGITGYDSYKNMYVASWVNNMATTLLTMTGARDPSGKTWTFYGEMDEPMLDVQDRMVKYVERIVSPDEHVFTIYDLHAGDDYRVVEITYTRAK